MQSSVYRICFHPSDALHFARIGECLHMLLCACVVDACTCFCVTCQLFCDALLHCSCPFLDAAPTVRSWLCSAVSACCWLLQPLLQHAMLNCRLASAASDGLAVPQCSSNGAGYLLHILASTAWVSGVCQDQSIVRSI